MRRSLVAAVAVAAVLPVVPAVASTQSPAGLTDRALAAVASRAGLTRADLAVTAVRETLVGTVVRGRVERAGVPVAGSDWLVAYDGSRQLAVTPPAVRVPDGRPAARALPKAAALAAATSRLGVASPLAAEAQRVLVVRDDRLVDTWQVHVVALRPAVAARVDLDAATGRVLGVRDDARYVDGSAKVFNPNPVVARRDSALRQPLETGLPVDADLDSAALTAARTSMPLRSLDPAALQQGRLSGPYVNVFSGGYLGGPRFDLTRSDPRFEGLMAYAHIDAAQRYLQAIGFRRGAAVNAEPQDVVALPVQGFDNSFYQPGNDLLLFGAGGVDDAEDADVILHEYGHAMQDAQVPGWGANDEGGAMGEGFGDFLAGAYFARSNRWHEVCVADWDATTYSTGNPPCLRRLDGTKRWTGTATEVHDDGEIWSAYLWRLRGRILGYYRGNLPRATDASIRLVVSSHELLTSEARFADAVRALRLAARQLGHGDWDGFIVAEARRSGFIR